MAFDVHVPGTVLFRWLRLKLHREDRWSRSTRARNESGDACEPKAHEARSWCLAAAIGLAPPVLQWQLTKRIEAVVGTRIEIWNDKQARTHEHILVAIDRAHMAFEKTL